MQRSADVPAPRVSDRAGATALVAGVIASLEALEGVLARESDHIRVGRLREGLAENERKSALAAAYFQGLEATKANAIALARFARSAIWLRRNAFGVVAPVGDQQAVQGQGRAGGEKGHGWTFMS